MGYIEYLRKMIGHSTANLVGSIVIIKNQKNEILLQKRTFPSDTWSFPGGLCELGESLEETALREVEEETSLKLNKLKPFGFYSCKSICTGETGDKWYVYIAAYISEDFSGEVKINDGESVALEWVSLDRLPTKFGTSQKQILVDYINYASN